MKKVQIEAYDLEEAKSSVLSKISKRNTLWLSGTASWIILPERKFIGKKRKDDRIMVARIRRPFYVLFPKVYTIWNIKNEDNSLQIDIEHRMAWLTVLGFYLFSVQWVLGGIFQMIVDFEPSQILNVLIPPALTLVIGIFLLKREMRINENILVKLAEGQMNEAGTPQKPAIRRQTN